jgi:hypothetical protein
VITWDKTTFPNADSFYVYREVASNTYKIIERRPYSALSQFVDTVKTLYFPNTGNPNIGTYRYKLATKDSCGNLSTFSPYHNTLFIVNNNGTFSWPQLYAIENSSSPVIAYVLERDNLSNGNWQAVGSVAATQQFIIDPNYSSFQSTASWRVRTQWNIFCVPTLKSAFNSSSFSNKISNAIIGMTEISNTFSFNLFPQPAKNEINIEADLPNGSSITISLADVAGKILLSEENKKINSKTTIDISKYPNGLYILQVDHIGQRFNRRIIKIDN